MKKTVFSLILVFSILLSLIVPVSAEGKLPGLKDNGEIIESEDGIYNPEKAVDYARQYTDSSGKNNISNYNQFYQYYTHDCANYVSQCLLYGGLKSSDKWKPRVLTWTNVDPLFYYLTGNCFLNSTYNYPDHYNFSYFDFLKSNSDDEKAKAIGEIKKGDIIYVEGTDNYGNIVNYAHVMIVSKVEKNGSNVTIYTCAHTNNRKDYPLDTKYIQLVIFIRNRIIKFDANGGNDSLPDSICKANKNDIIMGNIGTEIPTRDGYTFIGWSATKDNAEYYECISSVNVNNPEFTLTDNSWTYKDYCNYSGGDSSKNTLTLYAQWEAKSYVLKFNANGGTGSVPRTIIKTGTNNIGDIGNTVPIRTGYVFMGWSAIKNNTTFNNCIAFSKNETRNPKCVYTSEKWTYEDYCNNTGGDSSNDILVLYAQWKKK